jgi:hypothetical protein
MVVAIRIYRRSAMSRSTRSTIIFAALVVAGVVMAVVAPAFAPESRDVLSDFGAALFGGALAFYLIDVVSLEHLRSG